MIQLEDLSTRAPANIDREETMQELRELCGRLFDLQTLLYANSNRSLLIILQGLDASGKDSTIRHVFSCVNPMGCNVKSFKKPTEEERRYGFLWRIYKSLPPKGMIQIFNRSHYEDILVPTVYNSVPAAVIEHRYDYINTFERHLEKNGTILLKFFLHVSEKEQKRKLEQRLLDPRKKWKYDEADKIESENRAAYIEVYEEIFRRCSPQIPWEVIPADQKWYRNYLIAEKVVKTLEALEMKFPE